MYICFFIPNIIGSKFTLNRCIISVKLEILCYLALDLGAELLILAII